MDGTMIMMEESQETSWMDIGQVDVIDLTMDDGLAIVSAGSTRGTPIVIDCDDCPSRYLDKSVAIIE